MSAKRHSDGARLLITAGGTGLALAFIVGGAIFLSECQEKIDVRKRWHETMRTCLKNYPPAECAKIQAPRGP